MLNTVTGVAPGEIFLNCRLRTRLDLLKPNMFSSGKVDNRQACNKSLQDEQRKFRDLSVGDNVVVLNLSQGLKWLSGQVIEITGPLSHTR